MKLADFIHDCERRLAETGVEEAGRDMRILIAHALCLDRAQLLSQSERVLTEDEINRIEGLFERRRRREPVARIQGVREFWGLPFSLNEATLVPRPESETLIETALAAQKNNSLLFSGSCRILDLGTGSGCLLLALLHELPAATGLGIDCAPLAVEQARKNAEMLGLAARVQFKAGNWTDGIEERFNIIISNPPYIAEHEIPALVPEVRDFDPRGALAGGADGLVHYRFLLPHVARLLQPGGLALFEVGRGQAEDVAVIFKAAGLVNIETRQDLSGIERCVIGQKQY